MSRYARYGLTLSAIAFTVAGLLGGARIAGATPFTPHPIDASPVDRPTAHPLPLRTPSLPLSASASPSPGASNAPDHVQAPAGPVNSRWILDKNGPKPPVRKKLSEFLVKTGLHTWGVRNVRPVTTMSLHGRPVRPFSADGSTIILTGDQSNYFTNDITLAYGADVYANCQNMPKASHAYTYWIYPPDGSGPYKQNVNTDANGNCNAYTNFNLSTPWGGYNAGATINSDPAYPGVWVLALYDAATPITETEIVANSAINFSTYANLGLTAVTNDFTPGNTVVVGASGLNPAHSYAIGWVYTAGSSLPCEYTVPTASKNTNNAVCFTGAVAGLQAFGGNLTQYWGPLSSPSTNTAPTGAYDVQLYDTTDSSLVSHQQISIEPSNLSWTLTPYNASGGTVQPTAFYNSTYATDGILDQSVQGLTYNATNLPATSNGDTIAVTVSDPNGVVLTQLQSYNYGSGALPILQNVPTAVQAGGAFTKQVAFPLNAVFEEAFGPTQNPFAPNVLTAQLYDQTKGIVLGSKSFQLLGYYANAAWSTNSILQAGTTPTIGNVTITNTGGTNFGSWNGDAISGLQIASITTDGESLGLSSTTAVDSAGNSWTITSSGVGVNTVITATPNQRNVGIPVGGTLSFNVTVTVPAGKCTTPCDLPTQVLPEHGIAYSAAGSASPNLQVLASGVNPNTVVPTIAWSVQSESATANMAARASKYGQLTYIYGTANSPTSDYYTVNLTLNNVVSAGNHRLSEVRLTFPSAVDLNAVVPTLVSGPAGYTWKLYSNTTANAAGVSPVAGANQNVIAIACKQTTVDGCGIAKGASGTFVIRFPLFKTSFTETDIAAVANFDKGNAYGNCGSCADAAYTLSPTSTTVNAIAGATNVDSSMLSAYSLNPTLMTMQFQPGTVGTGGGATSGNLVFTNTPASHDPNPDWVDEVNLTFPAGTDPASITVPAGWYSWETAAGSRQWVIALCPKPGPTNANPCSTNETANAIAPGGQLNMTVNWSAGPAAGNYNVGWYVTGANGGVDTSAMAQTTPITFSNTTASAAFTQINGAIVPNGTEPQVGADVSNGGSTFVYTVVNTGSTAIQGVTLTIPSATRSGTNGTDNATGNAGYFNITAAPTLTYSGGASGCTVAYTNVKPAGPVDGSITLTGCNIPKNGGTVNIVFVAQSPYLVGNEFTFPSTITSGGTNYATQPTYSAANVLSVILNGTLTLLTPNAGWVFPTQPNSVVPADATLTPQTNCVSCRVLAGSPTTVDFGVFNGTFNAADVLDASVRSDANNPNSWVLYVTTSPGTNPSNMLSADIDNGAGRSSSHAGFTLNQTTMTPVLTTTPGLQLANYSGNAYHGPLDSVMNFSVATGGNTSPQTVTLTYTLVFN